MKSQSHSWAAIFSPNNWSCFARQSFSRSGCKVQCSLIGLNPLVPASAPTHVLWKKFPVPLGVDKTIAPPPVANVCWDEAQISSILSTNAASSIINSDKASDLPASPELDTAFTWDPLEKRNDNLLSSTQLPFNHPGNPSCITLTLVTKFLATSCLVAITRIFLSLWNSINHKE